MACSSTSDKAFGACTANATIANASETAASKSALTRVILAALGILFVVIAAVGVFLPGIPTVGPLIAASVLLTKSSPALERRLVRNRFFARYLYYLDGTVELPWRAKLASISMMWTSILISYGVFFVSGARNWWVLTSLVLAGLIGTVFIIRFGKK